MNRSDVATRMERWIRTAFSVSPADPRFGQHMDLFDNGYVDSVGLAELLGFVEDEFGVEIPDEILVADEFATIDGMSQAVCRLAESRAIAQTNGTM